MWQTCSGKVVAVASLHPEDEVRGPGGLAGGFPGWSADWGALALRVLGVSHSCPSDGGLPALGAVGAARLTTGTKGGTCRGAGVVAACMAAAEDG